MKFFSRELSKKLQEIGCKSESGFTWGMYKQPVCNGDAVFTNLFDDTAISAFCELDFLGTSEQAKENCMIVFGEGKQFYCPCCELTTPCMEHDPSWNEEDCYNFGISYYHRHKMLDSPDGEEYLEKILNRRGKVSVLSNRSLDS